MTATPAILRPVIVALDVDTQTEALQWVDKLGNQADIFKVGLQLFSREGIDVVEAILARGKRVFVDLKLHDIPNTVAQTVRALARPGVEFLTLHASGGEEMLESAVEALAQARSKTPSIATRLLAVTVLTSLDDEDLRQIGINHTVSGQVLHLARLAHSMGIDGVVASPLEVRLLRGEHGRDLVIVTPGIRPGQSNSQDQKRVMTPLEAVQEGSDFLVMGRSLLEATAPDQLLQQILADLKGP